jgi:glycosyltransferase involved in cell wall biosynthesis
MASHFLIDISVIIPLYNEEESLPELAAWIERVMSQHGYSYEVIFVNDGSSDDSWQVIQDLREKNQSFKGISFNRNYGKSAALNMGFKACKGEVVITMDADLQDSPDEIPELYGLIKEKGFHIVSGWKQKRYDPVMKTLPSKLFNAVTSYMSGIKLHDFNCGLKAYQNKVVKTVDVYGEMHRYIPVIAKWAGFNKITEKPVIHQARKYGVTKFGLERFIYGFLDLMSIMVVSRFKKRPMHFFGALGSVSFLIGFAIALFLVLDKFISSIRHVHVRDVTDQPLFFLALVAIIVGTQLFLAGFLGEILASNNRKNEYIVAERLDTEEISQLDN